VFALLGNGDGTFTKGGVTPTPIGGYLALGDFNHDGNLDFATSGDLIAYGNGDGTFQTPVPIYPGLPGNLTYIIAGDLNNDGWPDLIIDDDFEASLYVLLNNHHGGFTEQEIPVVNPSGHGLAPGQMVLSDLNNDGNLDIVFAELYGTGASIFLGDGKGGFTFKASVDTPIYTFDTNSTIAVADFNGDGIPDIILSAASTLSVYLGTGSADFAEPSFYIGAGPFPGSLLTENLHGQPAGFPDIVAPDSTGGVMVLINATNRVQ